MSSSATRPMLKTLLFIILAPGTVAVWVPYLLLRKYGEWPAAWVNWLALVPSAIGAFILLWCARDFAVVGHGTPAPIDPPKSLVVSGLYRFVRNPMYWGIELLLLGEAFCFRSMTLVAYAIVAGICVQLFVLFYEEPTLRKKFGAAYQEYCQAVPRWIPRRTPWARNG